MSYERTFPNSTDCLCEIRDFVRESAQAMGFDEETIGLIELAIDEACSNIIRHAYRMVENGRLYLNIEQEPDRLVIIIRDTGNPFDPRILLLPDLEQHCQMRRTGGLGVYLMRTLMDHIDYKRTEQGNELILVKYLPHRKPSESQT